MNEHPILFSTPMVQAILAGNKTMTRRSRKLEVINANIDDYKFVGNWLSLDGKNETYAAFYNGAKTINTAIKCPYGQVGDMLWVRETWSKESTIFNDTESKYLFKSDEHIDTEIKWKPSIHMPKSACRIWLQVEETRVERLQEITSEDALREGIKVIDPDEAYYDYMQECGSYYTARGSFSSLWIKISGQESWNDNPWVWVIKFKIVSTTGKPCIE